MPSDDLAARVAALEDAVDELERARDVPRGPLGVPRPPTPRELRAFASEDAIPATIALLDAHVRALEALQAALRLLDPTIETEDARRDTLARLDAAVTDLRDAARDGLPENPAARDLLRDARALTDELETEMARASDDAPDVREQDDIADERERRAERVEDELDQLRDSYDDEDGDA